MTAPAATADWPTEPCEGRGCTAQIIWAGTNRGNAMPVDVDPVADGNVLLRWVGGKPYAEVIGKGSQARLFGKPARKSHFVTCPDADKFRRRR
jgi:hypothetical protein